MEVSINIRELKQWIAALDSGEYKQGECRLQDDTGYCCLGVGCKIIIPDKLQSIRDGKLLYQYPVHQPGAPIWLAGINDDFEEKTGRYLTALNDSDGFAFPEIATLLELVYIHKILD